jgi:hypothetical protein
MHPHSGRKPNLKEDLVFVSTTRLQKESFPSAETGDLWRLDKAAWPSKGHMTPFKGTSGS